jgi:hypothetical protein
MAWLRSLADRPGALGLLVSGAIVLVGTVRLYARDPVSQCPPPHGGIPEALGIALVVCCAVAFGIGGLSSETYRFSKHGSGGDGDALGPARSRARIAVQAILVLFLSLMAILLAYETYSLAHTDVAWPITWYVRCVSNVSTPASFVVATVVCGLLGHWLWYRPLTRNR